MFELDRTEGGRATVRINDKDGVLDPTNATGPYYGKIEPLLQAAIMRWNPVTDAWDWRFRGFIEDFAYRFDPSQQVNFLEVSLVDIFEILAAIEMVPGSFGDAPPDSSTGPVFYDTAAMDARITQALTDAGIPVDFYVVFSGNVDLWPTSYSAGESPLTVIQEAAEAEFPGVSNVYTDRFGRLAVHGRLAKFDPAGVAAGAAAGAWDFHHWNAGDGEAVASAPATYAQIRRFAFNRGLSKIVNSALAYPVRTDAKETTPDSDIAGQLVQDLTSIGTYGIRSWSRENLLTKSGLLDSSTALGETRRFAEFMVDQYAQPQNRVTEITFQSISPTKTGASENWRLLSKVDISDLIDVTIASPGGGGFTDAVFFVEGVHEECRPLNTEHDFESVSLDLSPQPSNDAIFPTS